MLRGYECLPWSYLAADRGTEIAPAWLRFLDEIPIPVLAMPEGEGEVAGISINRLDVIGSKTLLRILARPLPLPLETVASVLSGRRGAIVARHEIVDEIWGECASGGPLSAKAMIGLYVALLRARGLPIATFRARGYGIGIILTDLSPTTRHRRLPLCAPTT